jgi:medium-chain acyl-[acyl-carrier-protein] hydrolase
MNSRERYEETFSIVSYEADYAGYLSLYALMNRFQELAGIHAAYLQVGYNTLKEAGLAWILSRMKVQIHSLPCWGDTVHLATWPKGIDRLFALRDFCVTSDKGQTLVNATSAWLLIDTEKGRPRRIESLPIDLHFPNALHALQDPLDKIQMPEEIIPVFEKPVWLSDLDTNRHVNNAQYVKWVTDCFSEEQFRNRRITSLQINYLEETLLGDTVRLFKTSPDVSASEYFLEGVSRKNGTNVFHAHIVWE